MKVFSLPVYRGESVGQGCVRVCDGNGGFAVVNEVAAPFVVEAINNHDRLAGQVVELREALQSLVGSATVNEEQLNDLLKCGDYGESEALCKGRQLLNKLAESDDRELLEDIAKLNKLGAHRDK